MYGSSLPNIQSCTPATLISPLPPASPRAPPHLQFSCPCVPRFLYLQPCRHQVGCAVLLLCCSSVMARPASSLMAFPVHHCPASSGRESISQLLPSSSEYTLCCRKVGVAPQSQGVDLPTLLAHKFCSSALVNMLIILTIMILMIHVILVSLPSL